MRIQAKKAMLAVIATFGVATAAVAVQPSAKSAPQQHQQMMSDNKMRQGQMMNDPKMHQQMAEMMSGCSQMMKQMNGKMDARKN